ncbi:MAG: DEAD/DEAH box helicase, partial [Pyrinomonadaceae bacterium]
MKIALKEFQADAVEQLLRRLRQAKAGVKEGLPQAVVLSAPTGSGKTVITAAIIEEILEGSDRFDPEPDAVFLWLSDQPELNEQSRRRIAAVISKVGSRGLVLVATDFDQETFTSGNVYFLNTQKLGKDKLLTNGKGDKRHFTIWETIANTAQELKDHFYLIIDEAHRGTRQMPIDEMNRKTIMQKFVLGSDGEIPAIDLILGVSATPQRFNELLEAKPSRGRHAYEVPAEDVRQSGLLKDRIIVYHPNERSRSDWTLLAEAARQWKLMCDEWRTYTDAQRLSAVNPVMVIQVEDSHGDNLSATDLDSVLATLHREIEGLKHGDIAHCFEDDTAITAGGMLIPKIDASRIQEEIGIKIVLFKMALTTGWDCPRAEVMMSFRAAQDDTLIAQLIGRMVRTPLARRIEGCELLNTVALYLPKFAKDSVEKVIGRLKSDPDAVPPTDVEDGAKLVPLKRDPKATAAFDALTGLPTYRVERIRKASNTRRLMRLSRLLTMLHEIDRDAWDTAKHLIIQTLDAEKTRLMEEDTDFQANLKSYGEITINAVTVEQGIWKELPVEPI